MAYPSHEQGDGPRFAARAVIVIAVVSIVGTVAVGLQGCGGSSGPGSTEDPAQAYLNWAPDVAYVGMDSCQGCHQGIHSTYTRTGMGQAFYPMTSDVVVEDFADNNTFTVPESGLTYRMVEREDRFYQQQFLLDSTGAEMAFDERELIWVVGSNNHSRSYLTTIDDKLFQAPACWYPQASKWELCPGYEFKNDHFGRETSLDCLHCHNGRMELVEGQRNEFQQPFPHGIGCERCHGPGALHVEKWAGGDEPQGELDPTIVNPRRLPRQRRIEICFQCHLGDAKASVRVARHDREMKDFRPGQPLADYAIPYMYAVPTQWEFGLSAQADRLLQSRCFKESEGRIECLTCHNPHFPVYEAERDSFRKRCLGCHAQDECGLPVTDDSRIAAADDCVSCHMRTAEPGDQRFTEFTDHWIRKRIDLTERDHREDYTIVPAFPEAVASLSEGERQYYQGRANFLLAMDAPTSRRPPLWDEAERRFNAAIEAGFDEADAWFFLGKTRVYKGETSRAQEAFTEAVNREPEHHDANFALGQALYQLGRVDEAGTVFKAMLERSPDDPMALAEYARVAWTQKRYGDALDFYSRATALEPWNPTLQLNHGMSFASLSRFDEAAAAGEAATALDPDDPGVWNLFYNAMREAGQVEAAHEGRLLHERLSAIPESAE